MKTFIRYIGVLLFLVFSSNTSAMDFGEISASISLFPKLSNGDVSDVPGSNNLDDSAYQYQLNYFYSKEPIISGLAATKIEYISFRLYKYLARYYETEGEGASANEGIALFYGQRYMLSESVAGVGFGWYAGGAMGTSNYVEIGFNTTPIEESVFAPLAAAELFYLLKVGKNFSVEPALLVVADQELGGIDIIPQFLVGYFF